MQTGYISTERFAPIMERLVLERWPHSSDTSFNTTSINGHKILSEKTGIPTGMCRDIQAGRQKTIHFDVADTILCALGRPDIWYGELGDIYWEIDLSAPAKSGTRVRPSDTCCPRGHEFNKENTYVRPDGRRTCRACKRIRDTKRRISAESRARDAQRSKERSRRYRDRQKELAT